MNFEELKPGDHIICGSNRGEILSINAGTEREIKIKWTHSCQELEYYPSFVKHIEFDVQFNRNKKLEQLGI